MTAPLRVAQVIQYFEIGGIERMVQTLAAALRPHGVQTAVAAYLGDGPVREALVAQGSEVVLLPGRAGLDPLLPLRLARWLRATGAQVVHTHHFGPFLYGAAAARLAGLPQIQTEHSHAIYDAPRRLAAARSMDRLASVVAVSEEVARWRGEALGRCCRVIPNGVALPRWDRAEARQEARQAARRLLEASPGDLVVGCVARLAPEKDHLSLLRAFSAASAGEPRLALVLVGDGPERPRLEAEVARRGLGRRVSFLGSRGDVAALLPGVDLFTLASLREGLPLALLEALAHGVPAVTTDAGELPRVLSGGAGLVSPAGEWPALASNLLRAATAPAWRASAGAAGRALVASSYSVEAMARSYLQLYRAATGARRAA